MDLKAKLDNVRRELLDLSLRNPLLNYRTLKAKGLEIISEKSDEVFRLLVTGGKKMTFLVNEQAEDELIGSDDYEDYTLELSDPQTAYKDLKLQTRYSEKELSHRLLSTYLAANTCIEETGVNTLFLALGMLKWREADSSSKENWAPLILVPITLERTSARERFSLKYMDEDISLNVSLEAKLKSDFSINIQYDSDELRLDEYYEFIRKAVRGQKDWEVEVDKIAIGFFSFSKYLMYLDLDIEKWAENPNLVDNKILNALLGQGFKEPGSAVQEEDHIDSFVQPESVYTVMDADGSQTLAMLDVNNGRNLVVQGPPGTGKSQTIANIIAEAVARGKKVLFVSEKMAALDVVKRRLTAVGLGDVCLELHSHKTNKKDLLKELENTMFLGKPKVQDTEEFLREYAIIRDTLNQYCGSVNLQIAPSRLTPIDAYGVILRIQHLEHTQGFTVPRVDIDRAVTWTDPVYLDNYAQVEAFQEHAKTMKSISDHPFKGTGHQSLLPSDVDAIIDAATISIEEVQKTEQLFWNHCASRKLTPPDCVNNAEKVIAGLSYILLMPDQMNADIQSPLWKQNAEGIRAFIEISKGAVEKHTQLEEVFADVVWDTDTTAVRQTIAVFSVKWWRFLSGDYRKARRQFDGYLKAPQKRSPSDQVVLLDTLLDCKKMLQQAESQSGQFRGLFGIRFSGILTSDWVALERTAKWITELHRQVAAGSLFEDIISYASGVTSGSRTLDSATVQDMTRVTETLKRSLSSISQLSKLDGKIAFGKERWINEAAFKDLARVFQSWIANRTLIHEYAKYNLYSKELADKGLHAIINLADKPPGIIPFLTLVLEKHRYEALIRKAMEERPELARFDQNRHEQLRTRFVKMDKEFSAVNTHRILKMHWDAMPKDSFVASGQIGVLKKEFQKKTRHMPIRKLVANAGNAIQALKPVMMMSPLSIANFIEPGLLDFDLVVFDEASQVKPVEAFGALLRGQQAVVVGDSQQMPPTSFFDKAISGDEYSEEDDGIADIESILGLFLSQNAPQRMLRWHYRSRHESLIAVSNKEFYDSKLVVFPSAVEKDERLGLVFHHLPEAYYERGKTQSNPIEAKIIAEHVIRHAKEHPDQTLGVAAFSMSQMDAIYTELEKLRRKHIELEPFFNNSGNEPFFVKNLENIQGDERDVIFISVGYGKTPEGYLTMSFGPLNRDGGHRRLNVLITRARQRCEVFSNITADDIDLSRTGARGVQCLKAFLNYAEKGILDISQETGRGFDSEFEQQVYRELKDRGHDVRMQIGCSGFFIDLAIVDPRIPGRYLVGVECDGAAYHSARSARDRDRLRQMVLESKGWNIYRIWSTDWFKNPKQELDKLDRYIAELMAMPVESKNQPVEKTISEPLNHTVERTDVECDDAEGPAVAAYNIYWPQEFVYLTYESSDELIPHIEAIVRHEGPVHHDELLRRTASIGGKRAGSKISTVIERGIRNALIQKCILKKDMFYHCGDKEITLRTREALPQQNKKIEYVSPEEIGLAAKYALSVSCGLAYNDMPGATLRVLGFMRKTEELSVYIQPVIQNLIDRGEIDRIGDNCVLK